MLVPMAICLRPDCSDDIQIELLFEWVNANPLALLIAAVVFAAIVTIFVIMNDDQE